MKIFICGVHFSCVVFLNDNGQIWYRVSASVGLPDGKEPACQCGNHEMRVQYLGQEDPLEEGMATHSIILAWRTSVDGGAYSPTGRSPTGRKESDTTVET